MIVNEFQWVSTSFNEFQWVSMEHDVNINYMKLCSVSQSTENLEIHYLKIMCIYIYWNYIYTSIYQIRKNMSGRPPFPLRPRGRPSHFASQSSDIPRAWWCRPSNCRWWEHPEDTFFSWRSIESMSNTKKGLCWDLKMDIIACPDIYNHMYIIYILQKQQNSKFHQYWALVSCKPQISGVNSKSRLVMGGLQSWGGVRQGKMNAQQTNLSAPSPKTYTEQLTMMTMISHEFADHEFRMKYMFFFNKHMAMGQTRYPKTGWCTLR